MRRIVSVSVQKRFSKLLCYTMSTACTTSSLQQDETRLSGPTSRIGTMHAAYYTAVCVVAAACYTAASNAASML
jgi:hypothetical protein